MLEGLKTLLELLRLEGIVRDRQGLRGRYTPRRDLNAALWTHVSPAGNVGLVVPHVHPGIEGRVGSHCVPLSARRFIERQQIGG